MADNNQSFSLVWFRGDLRLHDNEPLTMAIKQSQGRILPFYCFDVRQFGPTYSFGFPKTGPFRAEFLIESVQCLRDGLRKLGSDLIVRVGKPEEEIPKLIKSLNVPVTHLFGQKEITSEETDCEKSVHRALGKLDKKVESKLVWGGQTMHHIDDLPFQVEGGHPLKVFTHYRTMMESKNISVRQPFPSPSKLQSLPKTGKEDREVSVGDLPDLDQLMAIGNFGKWLQDHVQRDPNYKGDEIVKEGPTSNSKKHRDPAQVMTGGEVAGLKRLHFYLWEGRHIDTYKSTRNGLLGSTYATKFSPWLATGCLSVRQIYHEIKKYESKHGANDSTYWVTFELMWRDYFKWVGLKHKNDIFKLYGLKGEKKDEQREWKKDVSTFEMWARCKTGYPFVDANMRELTATGHMSNRGRQNVASFLTKDMKMDWRMGAEFFESFLIDHDVTSNYCNWLYVAGVGNDPKENRYFNVVKQGHMYDSKGEYVCYWFPQLKKLPDADHMMQPFLYKGPEGTFSLDRDYCEPVVKVNFKKEGGDHHRSHGKKDFKIKRGGHGGRTVRDGAPQHSSTH
ncbi:cryptochrome DASH-like [Planoprotostelium fungivorum]|uniref:Cryptochrome DASH n=1 Tax=Planoprotostelium fungivorum TaxID=1890364 RepID=A0A2P6MPE2_9EUKA|nr:cryptochrome DASH-like [Planoprotostelium fungivorum]